MRFNVMAMCANLLVSSSSMRSLYVNEYSVFLLVKNELISKPVPSLDFMRARFAFIELQGVN